MNLNHFVETFLMEVFGTLKYFDLPAIIQQATEGLIARKEEYKPDVRYSMDHMRVLLLEDYRVCYRYVEKAKDDIIKFLMQDLEGKSIKALFEVTALLRIPSWTESERALNFKYNRWLVKWAYEEIKAEDPNEIVIEVDKDCRLPRSLAYILRIPEKDWKKQSRERLCQYLDWRLEACDCLTPEGKILVSLDLGAPILDWLLAQDPLEREEAHQRFFNGLKEAYGSNPKEIDLTCQLSHELLEQLHIPKDQWGTIDQDSLFKHVVDYVADRYFYHADDAYREDKRNIMIRTGWISNPLHDLLNPECLMYNEGQDGGDGIWGSDLTEAISYEELKQRFFTNLAKAI